MAELALRIELEPGTDAVEQNEPDTLTSRV